MLSTPSFPVENVKVIYKLDHASPKETEVTDIPLAGIDLTKPNKKRTKGLRGRKKKMVEELIRELGVVTYACKTIGISRITHYQWMKDDPIYAEACTEAETHYLDVIERAGQKLLQDKNPQVIIHLMKTKLKNRGYADKIELEHSGVISIPVINLVEKSVTDIKNDRVKSNDQSKAKADDDLLGR